MAIQVTKTLVGLRDSYEEAELVLLDLATTCRTFEIAWKRIHIWASDHMCQGVDPIFEQLLSYHETSQIVLSAFKAELQQLEPTSMNTTRRLSFKNKARSVLHEQSLKDHGDRLHRQISSLNLLLSTAQL